MRYTVEFDPEMMRPLDYMVLECSEYRLMDADAYDDLVEYVIGMGYEWERVAYTWEVVAA